MMAAAFSYPFMSWAGGAAHLHNVTRGLAADAGDMADDLAAPRLVWDCQPATALHLHGGHACAPRYGRGWAGGVQRVLYGHPRA